MWQVVESAQLMRHGVAYSQERIGECHTGHAGSISHLLTCLYVSRLIVSSWQVVKHILHGLKCKAVRVIGSHDRSICLKCMGQDVNAGCACQSSWLAHHIISVHNCHVWQEGIVSQRIFDAGLLVCDDCERRNLGTST